MSEQKNMQTFILQRPTTSNAEEWASYWGTQGQHWRTEPEIPEERQKKLEQCRAIVPDINTDTYPFRGIELTRADVEWLLATHENGLGPVDWSNKSQKKRQGLDLHGRPFLSSPSGIEGTIAIVEAFIGLIVEAILIAIITQRILGK